MAVTPAAARRTADRGAILVLTLVLTVIMAVVVLAIASFVTVGLRTSETTDLRNETNADATAAVTWLMEEFRWGRPLTGYCGPPPGVNIFLFDRSVFELNGTEVQGLACETRSVDDSFPILSIRATATKGGTSRTVEAVAQFDLSAPGRAVTVLDWRVDE